MSNINMNLIIQKNITSIDKYPFEVVERKGLGHPDTIADGIAESISNEYSKHCLNSFGVILHHNVDKISVLGGLCKIAYGVEKYLKPIQLILNGRMSRCLGDIQIDIRRLQENAAKKYIKQVLPRLNVNQWVNIHSFITSSSRIPFWFSPRSIEDLPEQKNPRASDTSTVIGFWPLSRVEKIVLECERFFYYRTNLKPRFKFIGSDIKIMAIRNGKNLNLTLCIPFFAGQIKDIQTYLEYKKFITNNLSEHLQKGVGKLIEIKLEINTQDQKINPKSDDGKGRYLSLSGSALDFGEEGVTGRGNRSRGLISCMRPSSVESIYGKNPVYHTGKVYAHIANTIAKQIAIQLECETDVIITTRNSDPLYSPYNVIVKISKDRKEKLIKEIIERYLKKRNWSQEIVKNKVFLPINELKYGDDEH